jgi:ribosomal protein S18 acetylase RimI-like enzyme
VSAPSLDVIRWGRERARTGPWRGDRLVAHLVPMPEAPPLSAGFVRRALDVLAEQGYRQVVTSALGEGEAEGFVAAGFDVGQRLHLLVHGLDELPPMPAVPARLRRAWPFDRATVLEVDNLAFAPFWRLDDRGLDDALGATPRARFRVAVAGSRPVGYAIIGAAGRRGFVQRLAVHPNFQGRALGRALLIDGLRWLQDRSATAAVVNTQFGNDAALALYEATGFRRQPHGLAVLTIGIGS